MSEKYASKKVFLDCCKQNGAIVASNHKIKNVKDYKFVWPRDGAFTCMAAKRLGVVDIQEKFFRWCMKTEGWNKTGLLYKKYKTNGVKVRQSFQSDNTGMVLIAVHDFYLGKKIPKDIQKFIIKTANGLCKIWNGKSFSVVNEDCWEERKSFPELGQNFTFSIAVCSKGLKCAYELLGDKKWILVSNSMNKVVLSEKDFFRRKTGKLSDDNVDASLLGLVWPCEIVSAKDKRMVKTVKIIENSFGKGFKVHRYDNDEYDGWMINGVQAKQGAGYWPLLNFWMSIYYLKKGNKNKAMKYYDQVLKDVKGSKIPEQVFDNKIQKSVTPLCWSHSMFVFVKSQSI